MEKTITLPYIEFAHDPTFQLVVRHVACPKCGTTCSCEGYDGQNLVYCCPCCDTHNLDSLAIEPLFALDPIEAAAHRHYEIACPYCGGQAAFVGGNTLIGLFFVCKDRCHSHRYIRRH